MRGPPRLLEAIARWLLPGACAEFVLGDLHERYADRAARTGVQWALLWYVGAVARSAWAARPRGGRPSLHGMAGPRDVASDVRIALRTLRRRPAFAVLAVATLALGVGAATAVFGVVNQLVLRPLPGVLDGAGAAYVEFHDAGGSGRTSAISLPVLQDLEATNVAAGVAGFALTNLLASGASGDAAALTGQVVAGPYFEVLGVRPTAGRLFAAGEAADVVVLSERAKARLFGSEEVVGRTVRLNRRPVTVIGTVGSFAGVQSWITVDAWVPVPAFARLTGSPDPRGDATRALFSQLVTRPRATATLEALEADLDRLLAASAAAHPDAGLVDVRARVFGGLGVEPMWRADTRAALAILAGIGALVLLVACANVANLLLYRALRLRAENAVRRALGASGGRVARQQLIESLVIAAAGVACGIAVAFALTDVLEGMRLATTGRVESFRVDGRVLVFLAGLVLVTTVLAGAAPALLARGVDLRHALGQGQRQTARGGRVRAVLTVAQLGVSLCLMVGSVLLVRTIRHLYAVDAGFAVEDLHLVTTFAQHVSPEDRDAYPERLLASVRSVPGVEDVALDSFGPFGPSFGGRIEMEGDTIPVQAPFVSTSWFATMGIPIVRGRALRPEDADGVVLSENLARRLFGDEDAIGRSVHLRASGAVGAATVVGVARAARTGSLQRDPGLVAYRPWRSGSPAMTLLVRAPGSPAMSAAILAAARAAGPDLPPPEVTLASKRRDGHLGEQRFFARLLPLLTVLAGALAAVGLYGLIATGVGDRVREIGIRRALGARDGRIVREVLGQVLVLLGVGLAIGLPAALGLARLLRSRLFGVGPLDPASWIGAILLFGVLALAACIPPIRTAVRVDPAGALREG